MPSWAAQKGLRLDPRNSELSLYQQGRADTLLGRWEAAIPAIKPYQTRYPGDFWAHAYLAVDYMELHHDNAGRAEVAEVLSHDPQFTVETVFPTIGLQRKELPAEIDRFRADLHKAGLK